MLRKADNVRLGHKRGFWTSNGDVIISVGKKRYYIGKVKEEVFLERLEAQLEFPMLITSINGRRYWQFRNRFYWESEGLNASEVEALLVMQEQRKRRQIETAQTNYALGAALRVSSGRKAIPDDVKVYVMRRDAGSCRHCGSTSDLQYDHIIPLAMGGSNNAENLQILCGPCNRSKSAGLTVRR
ncbi:HNH endonuclease [Pseudarthrobacter sp. WHRI 8279]|uniref:HNH endonuclease n=1 Tax=Pseudarthrobacter sp. WHRI 8279 TaxID=3162566 RepID=UPI0035A948F2